MPQNFNLPASSKFCVLVIKKGGINIQPTEDSLEKAKDSPIEPANNGQLQAGMLPRLGEAGHAPVAEKNPCLEDDMPSDCMLSLCQQLSINESRLFYIGIQAMKEQLRQGMWREILLPTASIVQLFGGNKGYYDQLKKIAARLVKKKITANGKSCGIFQHIRFNPAEGGLFMMFNPEIRQMLEDVARRRMEISIKEVFEFKSRYTVRLLEVFGRYMAREDVMPRGFLKLAIEVGDLKRLLGIPMSKTYEQITNIRHKVLNVAVEEINNSTSYSVDYAAIKEGGRVKAFLFTVASSQGHSLGA